MTDTDTEARAALVRARITTMKAETEALAARSAALQARILLVCEAVFDLSIPLPVLQDAVRADRPEEEVMATLAALVEGRRR